MVRASSALSRSPTCPRLAPSHHPGTRGNPRQGAPTANIAPCPKVLVQVPVPTPPACLPDCPPPRTAATPRPALTSPIQHTTPTVPPTPASPRLTAPRLASPHHAPYAPYATPRTHAAQRSRDAFCLFVFITNNPKSDDTLIDRSGCAEVGRDQRVPARMMHGMHWTYGDDWRLSVCLTYFPIPTVV